MNATSTRSGRFATPSSEQPTGDVVATVERVMREGHVPGLALAVVRHDRLLYAAGFGFADLRTRRPTTPSTQHLWFSMTKIVTATTAMSLAERGLLDLHAPIREYVEGYPVSPVTPDPTIGQLLNHTAGVANPLPVRWVRPAGSPAPDPDELLARLLARHGKPKYPIGGQARYSNLGYLILAQAIATAANLPFEAVVADTVLAPAAMEATSFAWRPDAPAATGYVRLPEVLTPALKAILPDGIVGERHGAHQAFRPFLVDGAGYGGLVGDVLDAGRLAALHLGDGSIEGQRILLPETAKRMRAVTTPGKPFDLGLGWFRRASQSDLSPAFVEHLGTGGGYYNALRIYPSIDLGVAIMANTTRAYDHHAIAAAAVASRWS